MQALFLEIVGGLGELLDLNNILRGGIDNFASYYYFIQHILCSQRILISKWHFHFFGNC